MEPKRTPRPIGAEQPQGLRDWFPSQRPFTGGEQSFEIGLVLAGAQSAGCYLGGVIDFLFQALDEWHQAKKDAPEATPSHSVTIKVIVGASAGGLTSALAAIAGRYRFEPAVKVEFEGRESNQSSPFYRAWVRDVDMVHLLAIDDLADDRPVRSALNSDYLAAKVDDYMNFTGDGPADPAIRRWLADPLPISLTVSNLEGATYGVRFSHETDGDSGGESAHAMHLHSDRLSFQRPLFAAAPLQAIPDHEMLPPSNRADEAGWSRLAEAVLASIAFPGALSQQSVERPNSDYDYRFVYFNDAGLISLAPTPFAEPAQVRFSALDGGLLDNEPFEIAHTVLAGIEGKNAREGDKAKRAVILVDPFISPHDRPAAGEPNLLSVPGRLYRALIQQAQFKPVDLTLAESGEIYSRFMIAPARRKGEQAIRGDEALASARLNAFSGYFSEHYRHHDFMLGRRNCQSFLREWFCLPRRQSEAGSPPGNSLFDGWPAAALEDPRFVPSRFPDHRPIIPLMGSAAEPIAAPAWPAGAFAGWKSVETPVGRRLDRLFARLRGPAIATIVKSRLLRPLAGGAVWLYWRTSMRRRLLTKIGGLVEEAKSNIDKDG